MTNAPMVTKNPKPRRWEKPLRDVIKINTDVAPTDIGIGIGVVARDWEGFVLGGMVKFKDVRMQADWAELEALREGIYWARNNNVPMLIVESDCAAVLNRLKKNYIDISTMGYQVKAVKDLLDGFHEVKVEWTNRTCNKAADCLSNMVLNKRCSFVYDMDYPMDICDFVIIDSC